MSLIDQAKADMLAITTNGDDFGVPLTFTNLSNESVTVNGLATLHHLSVDRQGVAYNGKNAHCSVAEAALTAEGYTVRDGNNKIALVNHKVAWTDSGGTSVTYKITEVYPDGVLGLIVCILSNYNG